MLHHIGLLKLPTDARAGIYFCPILRTKRISGEGQKAVTLILKQAVTLTLKWPVTMG